MYNTWDMAWTPERGRGKHCMRFAFAFLDLLSQESEREFYSALTDIHKQFASSALNCN